MIWGLWVQTPPSDLTSISNAVSLHAGESRHPCSPAGTSELPWAGCVTVCSSSVNELWDDLVDGNIRASVECRPDPMHETFFCTWHGVNVQRISFAPLCWGTLTEVILSLDVSPRALLLWTFPFGRDKWAALSYTERALLMSYIFWFENARRVIKKKSGR